MKTSYYYRQWRAYSLRLLVVLICIAWFAVVSIGLMLFGLVLWSMAVGAVALGLIPVADWHYRRAGTWLDRWNCELELMARDTPNLHEQEAAE